MATNSAASDSEAAAGPLRPLRLAAEAAALRVLIHHLDSCSSPAVVTAADGGDFVNPAPAHNDADIKTSPLKFTAPSIHAAPQEVPL